MELEEAAGTQNTAARLPARVVRAIEVQRDQGEILTSWVQAAIVAVLAVL